VDLDAVKPKLPADLVEPLAVAISQFPFRTLLESSDRNHDEAHGTFSGQNA
jgi:hypothetical protein